MITSELGSRSGFFSELFFTINHYIHALKTSQNFRLVTHNWLFKANKGWTDYFLPIDNNCFIESELSNIHACHSNTLGGYKIKDYKSVISLIYRFNDVMTNAINQAFNDFGLTKNNYGAIFVRRGDKLIHESKYVHASKYLEKLLARNEVKIDMVYVQTDDYNVILELEEFIKEHDLKITLKTNCPVECRGMIIFDFYKNTLLQNQVLEANKDYVRNKCNYEYTKPVSQMNKDEIYEHTKRMLIGIELVRNAISVVTDYESNVGRFIKLSMPDEKVESVIEREKDEPDYEKVINPSYAFRD